MDDIKKIAKAINDELLADNSDVRKKYLKEFNTQIKQFAEYIAKSYVQWKEFDKCIGENEKKAYISSIIHCVIALEVQSMALFISGHTIPAGNTQRQVIEAISLLILCSSKKYGILDKFIGNRYSTNKAVDHVLARSKDLNINRDAVITLKKTQEFYHNFSHPSLMTIAVQMSFSKKVSFIGAFFDDKKLPQYRKDIGGRVDLARIFVPVITVVNKNVSKWA